MVIIFNGPLHWPVESNEKLVRSVDKKFIAKPSMYYTLVITSVRSRDTTSSNKRVPITDIVHY
jgi:hypothetical protein